MVAVGRIHILYRAGHDKLGTTQYRFLPAARGDRGTRSPLSAACTGPALFDTPTDSYIEITKCHKLIG